MFLGTSSPRASSTTLARESLVRGFTAFTTYQARSQQDEAKPAFDASTGCHSLLIQNQPGMRLFSVVTSSGRDLPQIHYSNRS